MMIPCIIALTFWSEADAAVLSKTQELIWGARLVENCIPRREDKDTLVVARCDVCAPDLATSLPEALEPFLFPFHGSELGWQAQIYQYSELASKRCYKNSSSGGQRCKTVFNCSLGWRSSWVNSSQFQCPGRPSNVGRTFPNNLQASLRIQAPEYSVMLARTGDADGAFMLDSELQQQLPLADLADRLRNATSWPHRYDRSGGHLSPRMLQVRGHYLTTYDEEPLVGDLRISLSGRSAQTATIAAKQIGDALSRTDYRLGSWPPQRISIFGRQTKSVKKLLPGLLSKDDFASKVSEGTEVRVWLLRVLSLALSVVAFEMIMQPMSMTDLSALNCCTCRRKDDRARKGMLHVMAFAGAFGLVSITNGIAWVEARPALGIIHLAVAVLSAPVLVVVALKHRRSAREVDPESGPLAMAILTADQVCPRAFHSMEVTCPTSARPGDALTILTSSGQPFKVEMPFGVKAGETFRVQVPP